MSKQEKQRNNDNNCTNKRMCRLTCMLSEDELKLVNRYLSKYKITNRSRWFRETILMSIHQQLSDNYPTLFDEHEMRR